MAKAKRFFRVGAAKVDITPPLEVPYLGFEPRHSFFRGVRDRLFVRALVVSAGQKDVAVVNADLIGFSNTLLGAGRNFTTEVRKKVRERTGVPEDSVMLTSGHIHSTPDTLDFRPLRESPGAAEWLEGLIERIVESAAEAQNRMFDASLMVGQGRLDGFSKNRRGESCLDTEVIVLAFQSSDRSRKIFAVNFACHPVIVQVQNLVSSDYAGVMQSQVEKKIDGAEACLFLQGACGDINPSVDDSRNFDDVERMGKALGKEVLEAYGRISQAGHEVQPVILHSVSETLMLPSRPLPSSAELTALEGELRALEDRIEKDAFSENSRGNRNGKDDSSSAVGGPHREGPRDSPSESSARLSGRKGLEKKAGELKRKKAELICRIQEGHSPFAAEIQAIQLGNALLIGISGEPFCSMGRSIKEKARPLVGVPIGYANGYIGYIVPPESWQRGGYETECGPWSKVGPESYAMILECAENMIKRI